MALKLGVVGATGEVGRTMLKVLKEMIRRIAPVRFQKVSR